MGEVANTGGRMGVLTVPRYGRVVVKLSGEALAGSASTGVDPASLARVAQEVLSVRDAGEAGRVDSGTSQSRERLTAELDDHPAVARHSQDPILATRVSDLAHATARPCLVLWFSVSTGLA